MCETEGMAELTLMELGTGIMSEEATAQTLHGLSLSPTSSSSVQPILQIH